MRWSFDVAHIAGMMMLAASAVGTYGHMDAKSWEPVKAERTDTKVVMRETEIEIKAASGTLIVTTSHPIQIKVFTILGRLVNADTLPAGKSQLTLPAHGVYIVKVGDMTCKVAV